jgi:hypothetical protein
MDREELFDVGGRRRSKALRKRTKLVEDFRLEERQATE